MNSATRLPLIPQPPHDPTWLLLNAQAGWRAAGISEQIELGSVSGLLAIAEQPARGRLLAEASGSFGGLVLPTNVALSPRGALYLLDGQAAALKVFDPCACEFRPVPCLGGVGSGFRQLNQPHGIGICNDNLYICDTGNGRVLVLALYGFVLRAIWMSPGAAALASPWQPYDVAFDSRGRAYVTDSANGYVHCFSPAGRWLKALTGFGRATLIAIDRQDRLVVLVEGEGVRVVNTEGKELEKATRPADVAARFPRLPLIVDDEGNLHLAELCQQRGPQGNQALTAAIFDLRGRPLREIKAERQPTYWPDGLYLAGPLDSAIYRCQWHRIVLSGDVPAGCSLQLTTYAAETDMPLDHVEQLPDDAWAAVQTIYEMRQGEWEGLVRSAGGRYLWLRLEFKGTGFATPTVRSVRIEYPRISMRRYLPAVFGEEPVSADFTDRFLAIFDTTVRSVEQAVDTQSRLFDPLATPARADSPGSLDFLTWLASWIGLSLERHWPEAMRRQFVKRAARLYHLRGTRTGLWRQLLFYLGMEAAAMCCPDDQPKSRCAPRPANCAPVEDLSCAWPPPPLILEHYQLRRWLFVGAGRLGDQAELWGRRIANRSQLDWGAQLDQTQLKTAQDPYRDPFHVYAHRATIFVPACYGRSDRHRRALENLVSAEKPGHTLVHIEYVEPRFRIGVQSMIGFDAVIGRYPEDVMLDETRLGWDAVLSAPPDRRSGPSLQVGVRARIGTTTRLD